MAAMLYKPKEIHALGKRFMHSKTWLTQGSFNYVLYVSFVISSVVIASLGKEGAITSLGKEGAITSLGEEGAITSPREEGAITPLGSKELSAH